MSLIQERTDWVRRTLGRIRAGGIGLQAPNQEQIALAREALSDLAAQRHLFPEDRFPFLHEHRSGFYRLAEDADRQHALYVQVSRHNVGNQPHSHPHWAIITGVQGNELNEIFERTDDGSVPGRGRLRKLRDVPITPGVALYIPREHYHTIRVAGDEPGVHLHYYASAVDGPAHTGEPRFLSADSEEYTVPDRNDVPVGVQSALLADVHEAAQAGDGISVLALGETIPVSLSDAVSDVRQVSLPELADVELDGDLSAPVILAGESAIVRDAAAQLARRGYYNTFWFDA